MVMTQDGLGRVETVVKRKNPINSCRFVGGNGCTSTTLNGSGCKTKQKSGKCKALAS